MKRRKPILIVDDGPDSLEAVDILRENGVEFVEYDIRKFAESCCGDLPTTKAPSVFAPEGVFRELKGIQVRASQRAPIGRCLHISKISRYEEEYCDSAFGLSKKYFL
jgi:hypothetical protein